MKIDEGGPITQVTVAATSDSVMLAYCNRAGQALDVREFSSREHPELKDIVRLDSFNAQIWDIDMVLSLLDVVDADVPDGELLPLIPAYLQSLQAAS